MEGHGGPLQVKKHATGAAVRDAMGGEGTENFAERQLDIGERFHGRKAGAEDIGATDDSGGILAAFVIALVVVTELLAAKGGAAAGDAIYLPMVTSTKRHTSSKYNRPTAMSGQRKTAS